MYIRVFFCAFTPPLKRYKTQADIETALQVVERAARVSMALTVERWADALSNTNTDKLLARDLRDLQTALDKAPQPGKGDNYPAPPKAKPNTPKAPQFAQ